MQIYALFSAGFLVLNKTYASTESQPGANSLSVSPNQPYQRSESFRGEPLPNKTKTKVKILVRTWSFWNFSMDSRSFSLSLRWWKLYFDTPDELSRRTESFQSPAAMCLSEPETQRKNVTRNGQRRKSFPRKFHPQLLYCLEFCLPRTTTPSPRKKSKSLHHLNDKSRHLKLFPKQFVGNFLFVIDHHFAELVERWDDLFWVFSLQQ